MGKKKGKQNDEDFFASLAASSAAPAEEEEETEEAFLKRQHKAQQAQRQRSKPARKILKIFERSMKREGGMCSRAPGEECVLSTTGGGRVLRGVQRTGAFWNSVELREFESVS